MRSIRILLSPSKVVRRVILRGIIRGYRRLKLENKLHLVDELLSQLREQVILKDVKKNDSLIFGTSLLCADLIVRQRVSKIRHILTLSLLLHHSSCAGRVVCPLPREWSLFLRGKGYPVPVHINALLWHVYCLSKFASGIQRLVLVITSFFWKRNSSERATQPFAYFVNLNEGNLPNSKNINRDFSLIGWLSRNIEHLDGVKCIYHSVERKPDRNFRTFSLAYSKSPVPDIHGYKALIEILINSIKYLIYSLRYGCCGKWWYPLLFEEFIDSTLIKLSPDHCIAKSYWFHNGVYFPPLWAYSASDRGCKIIMYFYSTNSESWIRISGRTPPPNMYSLMNWPIYLVWDRYQYDVVRRYSNPSSEIKIVGPIVFASSGAPLPRINGPSVGIFDVQPHRVSQYVKYALPIEYYVPSVATAFLSDIYDVASIHDVNVVYKSKRNLGRLVHPEFRNFLPSYLDRPSIVNVPADTSAFEVIEKVDVVIAAPFTSVALIAKSMGKPVAYYDPIGIIKPHDPAAHGVCVIGGKWELIEWFDRVLHTKGCDHTL